MDNFGENPYCDITEIDEKELPEFDILLAGFPCQAFSLAGKRKGFEDARGTLFFDIARILNAKKPYAFLLENVKGLVGHKKGKTFKTILEILDNLEYDVFYKVLNSKDFGVPQNRERIYIIGFRKDLNADFKFPKPLKKHIKLKNILEKEVDDKYYISQKYWNSLKAHKEKHLKKGNGFGYCLIEKEGFFQHFNGRRNGKRKEPFNRPEKKY